MAENGVIGRILKNFEKSILFYISLSIFSNCIICFHLFDFNIIMLKFKKKVFLRGLGVGSLSPPAGLAAGVVSSLLVATDLNFFPCLISQVRLELP